MPIFFKLKKNYVNCNVNIKTEKKYYEDLLFKCVSFKANVCIVPLSLEQHKNSESLLKFMLKENNIFVITIHRLNF